MSALLDAQSIPSAEIISCLKNKDGDDSGPGFSVVICDSNTVLLEYYFGMSQIKKEIHVSPITKFNAGSVSKQFTAMSIFLLEEEGKLQTSDSVRKYIPELNYFGHTITIQHLLSHSSGLKEYFEVKNMISINGVPDKDINYQRIIAELNKLHDLTFVPGTDFQYSNAGYMLLALIAERVSGKPIGEFIRENIFVPLGMNESVFCLTENEGTAGKTIAYNYNEKKKKFSEAPVSYNALGATGLFCTVSDFEKWNQNFYQNCLGKNSDSAGIISKMLSATTLQNGKSSCYGGGMFIKTWHGVDVQEHSGGWNGYLMQYRRFPSKNISVIVCSNSSYYSPFEICDSISSILLERNKINLRKPSFYPKLPVALRQMEGLYYSGFNIVRYVSLRDSTLRIGSAAGKQNYVLHYVSQQGDSLVEFRDQDEMPVRFRLKSGAVSGFWWGGGNYFANERYFEKTKPVSGTEKNRAGVYRFEPYGKNLRVKYNRRKKSLYVKPVFFMRYRLDVLAEGLYQVHNDNIYLRFSDSGFDAGNSWVSHLQLRKIK